MKTPSVARILVGLAWPGMAHAANCGEWNPELVAVPSSTIASKAVTLTAGAAKEGVFFRLLDTDRGACSTGFDDDGGGNEDDDAIVFAQLVNG